MVRQNIQKFTDSSAGKVLGALGEINVETQGLSHRRQFYPGNIARVVLASIFGGTLSVNVAFAAESPSKWSASISPAAIVRPTYEGSDRYRVVPGVVGNVTYDDFISLGMQGLNLYWHHNGLRVGGGLTFKGKRKDNSSNNLVTEGDGRLAGMGTVKAAIGFRGFVSYDLGPINFAASVVKYDGSDNKGVNVDLGAFMPLRMTKSLTVTPHVGATWADTSYMQTFFGVTSTQSAASRFGIFSPGSGFKNIGGGVSVNYAFTKRWFVAEAIDVRGLLGDARHSPLSFSKTAMTSVFMVGYRF